MLQVYYSKILRFFKLWIKLLRCPKHRLLINSKKERILNIAITALEINVLKLEDLDVLSVIFVPLLIKILTNLSETVPIWTLAIIQIVNLFIMCNSSNRELPSNKLIRKKMYQMLNGSTVIFVSSILRFLVSLMLLWQILHGIFICLYHMVHLKIKKCWI